MISETLKQQVLEAVKGMAARPNVTRPKNWELRDRAELFGTRTKFGNVNFSSTVRNRSKELTVIIGDESVQEKDLNSAQLEIIEKLPETLKQVHAYLDKAPFVCVQRTMGNNPDFSPKCTLYVSTHRPDSVRIPYMWGQTLFPYNPDASGPDFTIIFIPEWQEKDRQALVFPELGVTYVLGTDYFGESKKGFLRMAMYEAKRRGMLGVHAGSKVISARDCEGKLRKYAMLFFGLTATGKTTHSCHHHGLDLEGEGVEVVQDDVVFWRPDGATLGTERGYYIKTDGLHPECQPLLYNAATKRSAIYENVAVDYEGNLFFEDETLTGNGRCIIQREELGRFMADSVNTPGFEEIDGLIIAFITRRHTVLPSATKLTPAQAAAAFMLGESIHTSGSNPRRAGESIRVVGTNPFIIGDEALEGNRFYEFVRKNPEKVQCYLLNTGGVGEIIESTNGKRKVVRKVNRIEIDEMAAIIRGIVRDTIEWEQDPYWGTMVPKAVEGFDLDRMNPEKFYSQQEIADHIAQLRKERKQYLSRYQNLHPDIMKAFKLD